MSQQSSYSVHNKRGGIFMLRKLQTLTLEFTTLFSVTPFSTQNSEFHVLANKIHVRQFRNIYDSP